MRVDGQDDLYAAIQIASSLTVSQNNHIVQMTAREIILHDMSRPMVVHCEGHEPHATGLLKRLCAHYAACFASLGSLAGKVK